MKVRVKLFATLTRLVPGTRAGVPFELTLPDGSTVHDLARAVAAPEGEVRVVFVNGIVQPLSYALSDGDELGVFPPIGGGSATLARAQSEGPRSEQETGIASGPVPTSGLTCARLAPQPGHY